MMDEEKKEEQKKESELETCRKERDEYLDGWKRAKADYANYKKEEAERFSSWAKMSNEALISDIIMVLDSLSFGISVLPAESPERVGMSLIRTQLEDVLRRYGLEKIEANPGDAFNPLFHEAVGEEESGAPPGSVAKEKEKGYVIAGKAIRPAKVIISKQK